MESEVLFEDFGGSSINCNVLVWLIRLDRMSDRKVKVRSESMKSIHRALDKAEITIAFPIRTLDCGANVLGGVSLDLGIAGRRQAQEI